MNKPITPGHITRWLLSLQEFDITIVDKLGKDNVVVDFLYRVENNVEGTPIKDSFLDENIFAISANTPWYVNIGNYLAIGKVPCDLSNRDQQKIIHHST